jgi:hypothetical protein
MIIFDLDGTLADCEHRRYFVDLKIIIPMTNEEMFNKMKKLMKNEKIEARKPDWKSFYEACDKDLPIEPVIDIIKSLHRWDYYDDCEDVHIWSGRCESVRDKTVLWLDKHGITYESLKMRPIGDYTPDEILKEKWLNEELAQGKTVEYVFDDRPKVVRMWRRHGIFVFNCSQHDRDF